ncbi:MAG: DNA repair protein RecO [Deltaproteobacteria bacterium]|nr:DNA repair protein RecO [Deltaproteobacteria bacterium]
MNRRIQQLFAIVLHIRNFGDAHRIIEVLTAEEGRIAIVARHARNSKKRFAGVLDLFANIEIEVTPTNKLWRLESARQIQPRLGLRTSLQRLIGAGMCCESVRLLVAEHQAAPEIYQALADALDCLEAGDFIRASNFYPSLLCASGITPDFSTCTCCGDTFFKAISFDCKYGGIVCSRCAPTLRPLPPGVAAAFSGTGCPDIHSANALVDCALDWIESQTGRPLTSRRVTLEYNHSFLNSSGHNHA